mgnify:CR=1 FL=1
MKSNNNKISAEVKSQVMIELAKGESGVGNISMRHGVSRAAIYSWLKAERAEAGAGADGSVNDSGGFVELSVAEAEIHTSLTKASLVFGDFSLSLEGKLSSSKLISIIKILEVTC